MRPIGWIGVVLIVLGVIGLATGGLSYTRSKSQMEVGPLKVETKEKQSLPSYVPIGCVILGAIAIGYDLNSRKTG